MKIKRLFDDLKKIGRRKYLSRNGEEELYFLGNNLTIEIVKLGENLDIIICYNGERSNYLNSNSLSFDSKRQIEYVIKSTSSIEEKSKNISKILLDSILKLE